jgi:uncharacterized protein (DUF1697 family)
MPRYVAFLRGINVGGHRATKERLKTAFSALGYADVSTFKQSGNVIFESNQGNTGKLSREIEEKLAGALGFAVPAFIRTLAQLKEILNLPVFRGYEKEGASYLVTFLPSEQTFPAPLPLTIPKSTAQVVAAEGSEVYSVTHGGGEGALPNPFVESKLKEKATTRNINVLREIVEQYC